MQVKKKRLVNAIVNREYLFDCLPVFLPLFPMERERMWIKSVQDMNIQRWTGGLLSDQAAETSMQPITEYPSLDPKSVWQWPLSLDRFSAYVPVVVVYVVESDLYVMKPESLPPPKGMGMFWVAMVKCLCLRARAVTSPPVDGSVG